MWIYICVIFISCLLTLIAEKSQKSIRQLFFTISVILPSIVSGARADSVGTDMHAYIEPMHRFANSIDNYFYFINSNQTLISGDQVNRFEKGYMTLVYLCSRISSSLFFDLFISELLIISLTLIALCRFNKKYNISITLGMFVFYMMFFNPSLNIVRQSLAMSVLIFSYTYLIEDKWIKYTIGVIIAYLFHQTAIIGIIPLFIYYFIKTDNKYIFKFGGNIKTISSSTIRSILGSIFIVVFSPILVNIVLSLTGQTRFQWAYLAAIPAISINQMIIRLPFVLLLIVQWNSMKDTIQKNFFLSMLILDLLLSMISGGTNYLLRVAMYPSIYYVFAFPIEVKDSNVNKHILIATLIIAYLMVYWYYTVVIMNYNATVPYVYGGFFN